MRPIDIPVLLMTVYYTYSVHGASTTEVSSNTFSTVTGSTVSGSTLTPFTTSETLSTEASTAGSTETSTENLTQTSTTAAIDTTNDTTSNDTTQTTDTHSVTNPTTTSDSTVTPIVTSSTTVQPSYCKQGNCTGNETCLNGITDTCQLMSGQHCYQIVHSIEGNMTEEYEVGCKANCEYQKDTPQSNDGTLTITTRCCQTSMCNRELLQDPSGAIHIASSILALLSMLLLQVVISE